MLPGPASGSVLRNIATAGNLLLVLFIVSVSLSIPAGQETGSRPAAPGKELPEGWYARIETSEGEVVARLMPEQAPQAVAHFVGLARGTLAWIDPFTGKTRNDPYYDGLEIHRVVAGQRFEVGDHTGTGKGSAPFYVPPEGFGPVDFGYGWRLGMTRAHLGKISGSLFFVTEVSIPWLTGRHPCFGVVWSGKDVVRKICSAKAAPSGKPRMAITVVQITIFKIGDPPPIPDPKPFAPKPLEFQLREDVKKLGGG